MPAKKRLVSIEKLSFGKSVFYGFQSVVALNLFLGAIIIASILQMDLANTAILITMSFLASGVATLIQAGLFMKYPVVQGVSFATIGAIVAITFKHDLATAFGSLILGAVIIVVLGYFKLFSKILKFIPPLVTGVIVLVIGISVMFTACTSLITSPGSVGVNFSQAMIAFVLIFVFMVIGHSKVRAARLIGRCSVLLAIVVTTIIAAGMGQTDFSAVANASWVSLPPFMPFGFPKFDLTSSLVFIFIYFIVMIETMGNWFAISFTAKGDLTDKTINKGILGEGLGCLIGAFLGGAPVTSYAPNCGVLSATKVYSRYTAIGAGVIIVVFSFIPKLMYVIACIPGPIMLGTLAAMCVMIITSGLRSIHHIELNERNLLIIGIPIFATIIVSLLPGAVVQSMPLLLSYLFSSSICIGAIVAVIVNALIPDVKVISSAKVKQVESCSSS